MGIPGILKEIGKGERVALSKLAIDHLEKTQRPLRIAIDAAIWNYQTQAGQGGKNPALRTLFFKLLKLLALPIHPVFVYDGKNKPLTKRGKTVSRYGTSISNEMSKRLVAAFRFPHHNAPGEAEAECALLQRKGIVDAVMSQDVDAIMFGSSFTLRDWSKEGTRGNKTPTHVNVLDLPGIKSVSGLDPDGMILVALLSGGDYDEAGIPGFGAGLACEIAKAGFGSDLLELVRCNDWQGIGEWRERLQYELETNESGYFKRKHKTLKLPEEFPDPKILQYYTTPAVTEEQALPNLETNWLAIWDTDIDVPALRKYTADTFDWLYKSGAKRFIRCFAQPYFQRQLRRSIINIKQFSADSILEQRQHFMNDGIPELRITVTPGDVVGIDITKEEENPEVLDYMDIEDEDGQETADAPCITKVQEGSSERGGTPTSPNKKHRTPPWDPSQPEKWWIPETILQLGMSDIVESWQELQREIAACPKKFATRKCPKQSKKNRLHGTDGQAGNIQVFFQTSKITGFPSNSLQGHKAGVVAPVASTYPAETKAICEPHSQNKARKRPVVEADPANRNDRFCSEPTTGQLKRQEQNQPPMSAEENTDIGSSSLKDLQTDSSPQLKVKHKPVRSDIIPTFSPSVDEGSRAYGQTPLLSLPQSVTQRPNGRKHSRRNVINSDDLTIQKPKSIASFFKPLTNQDTSGGRNADKSSAVSESQKQRPQNLERRKGAKSKYKAAVSRDSLPGTWKDVESTFSQKSRISFIDLTGD